MMDLVQQEQREEQMQCWAKVGQEENRVLKLGGPSLSARKKRQYITPQRDPRGRQEKLPST